jgi:valyl-tRNA synthetase
MQEAAFGLEGVGYEEMPTSKSDQMVPVKESSVPSLGELLNEIEEGEGAYEYEKGKKAGEEIEKKKMKKSAKKESIETKLAEIEKQGKIVTMEAQMDALDELIASKSQRVEMIGEDENLAELVDKKKMKAMQKEISLLEKRKEKMGKMYEKMAGKAYAKKEVVDEMDAVKWDMQNGASMDTAPRKVGPGNVDGPAASSEQSKNA